MSARERELLFKLQARIVKLRDEAAVNGPTKRSEAFNEVLSYCAVYCDTCGSPCDEFGCLGDRRHIVVD